MVLYPRRFRKVVEIECEDVALARALAKRLRKYFPVSLVRAERGGRMILVVKRWSGLETRYTVCRFDPKEPLASILDRFWRSYKNLSRELGPYGWP